MLRVVSRQDWVGSFGRPYEEGRDGSMGRKNLLAPDLLAMAVALEPEIVRKAETHHVGVELAGKRTRGHTTVVWFDRTGQEANVELVLEMDSEQLWRLLRAAVS